MANVKSNRIKNIFIIDAVGALISAIFLGVVLVYYQTYIGVSTNTLYFLAALPCFFIIYDLYCYFNVKNPKPYLKGIALANFAYCILSICLLILHRKEITSLGIIYFIGEIIILLVLIKYEWRMSQ